MGLVLLCRRGLYILGMLGADVLSVMLARGMMCDVRHPRQEEARWLAQGGGYIRRSSWAWPDSVQTCL